MSESVQVEAEAVTALDELEAAFDRFAAASLDPCTDDQIEDLVRRLEVVRNKTAMADVRLVEQLNRRSIPFNRGCKSTAVYLRYLLLLNPGEANRRVKAAERFGVVACGSMVVGPIFPDVATALAAGSISAAHAQVIADCVDKLPEEIAAEHDVAVERTLLEQAGRLNPFDLAKAGNHLRYLLDQDGTLNEAAYQERRRHLDFRRRADGTARIEGELTAEAAEVVETILDALAKPAPAEDGTRDGRTPGQRRHDALLDALKLAMKAQLLPTTAGVTTTLIVHIDADSFVTGHGSATTGHGYRVPASVAKRWAGYSPDGRPPDRAAGGEAEAQIIAVLLSKAKRVEAYSSVQRTFTEQQRLAMMARDFGCSFPLCDSTALHTEAHHIQEFQAGGQTSVSNGTLVCGANHRDFERMGWQSVTIGDVPHWLPPAWIDPHRTPLRKTDHDLP